MSPGGTSVPRPLALAPEQAIALEDSFFAGLRPVLSIHDNDIKLEFGAQAIVTLVRSPEKIKSQTFAPPPRLPGSAASISTLAARLGGVPA